MKIEDLLEDLPAPVEQQLRGAFLNHASGPWLKALDAAAFGPLGSSVDIDRDGLLIAARLLEEPEIAVAEYDPTTRAIDITVAAGALGFPLLVKLQRDHAHVTFCEPLGATEVPAVMPGSVGTVPPDVLPGVSNVTVL